MELDDMKSRWQELDRKLDGNLRLNTRLVRIALLAPAQSAVRRLTWSTGINIAIHALLVILIGSFLGDHIREFRFATPALVLHVSAIALLAASIQQMVTLQSVDYTDPVLTIQKKLERLRVQKVAETKWILWLSPLLWTPLLVVFFRVLGVDLWATALRAWIYWNFAFGVVFLLAMMLLARFVLTTTPFMQRLMDDIAGRSLMRARASLASVAEFEAE